MRIVILYMIWQLVEFFPYAQAISCFCTESHCTYGLCESRWCLVGIKTTGRVVRTCGNDAVKQLQYNCRRDIGEWSEVCSCESPYCNTFGFLRHQIQTNHILRAPSTFPPLAAAVGQNHKQQQQQQQHNNKNSNEYYNDNVRNHHHGGEHNSANQMNAHHQKLDSEPIIINRLSNDNINFDNVDNQLAISKKTNLIMVLIVVPLAVGAAAVCVVVANYYCKMC